MLIVNEAQTGRGYRGEGNEWKGFLKDDTGKPY